MASIPFEFYKLLPELKQEMFVWPIKGYFYQRKYNTFGSECEVRHKGATLTDQDLANHFFLYPRTLKDNFEYGSIIIKPKFGNILKWFVFDADSEIAKQKILTKVLPLFDSLNIDYIKEFGGDDNERMHVWIKCVPTEYRIVRSFIRAIFTKLGYSGESRKDLCEVFPFFDREHNGIRFPFGPHLKRGGKKYAAEYHGVIYGVDTSEEIIEGIKMFIAAKKMTTEEMVAFIKENESLREQKPRIIKSERSLSELQKKVYQPQNLPLPMDWIPIGIKPIVKNCPAIHKLLQEVASEQRLEKNILNDAEGTGHNLGILLNSLACFNDAKLNTDEGRRWFDWIVEEKRVRPEMQHQWKFYEEQKLKNPDKYVHKCVSMSETFDKCQGCPLKEEELTPRVFYYGNPVTKTAIKNNVNLVTPEDVRSTTFKRVQKTVNDYLQDHVPINILLNSPQGTGKSVLLTQLAKQAADNNFTVLIAVPTAKLAQEHQARLRALGSDAFILSSHTNTFGHQHIPPKEVTFADFDCPKFDEIQEQVKVGVSSSIIRDEHCQNCPLMTKCRFPNQYQEVLNPKHKIVIMQHAHFKATEAIFDLMRKYFSLLLIDELFIEDSYSIENIENEETKLLGEIDYPEWTNKLHEWLKNGGYPQGQIYPKESELVRLKRSFDAAGITWRIPDLVRYYNQHRRADPHIGIEIIYELPKIPVKVFADATPPVELLKQMTGIHHFAVYGEGEVLNLKKIHPENKVYQILDNSVTKTNLTENFDEIMHKICWLCEYHYNNGERTLITLYKNQFEKFQDFLDAHQDKYPTLKDRLILNNDTKEHVPGCIVISPMNKGTNAYQSFDVQFLGAGVFYVNNQMRLKVYQYKTVGNYYRRKNGDVEMSNPYPYDLFEKDKTSPGKGNTVPTPIQIIESINNNGIVFQYGQKDSKDKKHLFCHHPYIDEWPSLIYNLALAYIQQAIRIRFTPDKPRTIYILGNHPLPSFLVTDPILMTTFLNLYI